MITVWNVGRFNRLNAVVWISSLILCKHYPHWKYTERNNHPCNNHPIQWCNSRGGGARVLPWHLSPGNFCWPTRKMRQGKWRRKEGKLKRGRWKIKNGSLFEVLLFTRNANNVGNQVHMTLNIHIISRITNDFDVWCRKLLSKWVEPVSVKFREQCTCLFINTLKMITQRITSLILFCHRNYLQIFQFLNILQSNKSCLFIFNYLIFHFRMFIIDDLKKQNLFLIACP